MLVVKLNVRFVAVVVSAVAFCCTAVLRGVFTPAAVRLQIWKRSRSVSPALLTWARVLIWKIDPLGMVTAVATGGDTNWPNRR